MEEDIKDDFTNLFEGEKTEWPIVITMSKLYNMSFDKPVSFEVAVGLLEVGDFDSDLLPEVIDSEIIDYNVGIKLEDLENEVSPNTLLN